MEQFENRETEFRRNGFDVRLEQIWKGMIIS